MQKKYLYETHCHTSPVSKCGKATVRETLELYKSLDYAGVFITNHFIDGNINMDKTRPYKEKIDFYFSDYEAALAIGKEIGIDVLLGVELSYKGTDFLVYGLDKSWFLDHPEIENMEKKKELSLMAEAGALIIQAHPFREADYIECIRLFPRHVHGVEIFNASRSDFENERAAEYAKNYGLLTFAGSDNHGAAKKKTLGGMSSKTPLKDEADFINRIKNSEMEIFSIKREIS